ncbi:formylglycine-generating enzyme family protein [Sphingobium sp. LSP13-1-1.1]|uniref:formylglycine-generating enzyme family protein n=1 Tax=Sphingobium sp. LSP13-1-1.1 TaxID=3135234 RepID=UPI003449C369
MQRVAMIAVLLGLSGTEHENAREAAKSHVQNAMRNLHCRDCPELVDIPVLEVSQRKINMVMANELTWSDYLKSYFDGSCSLPTIYPRNYVPSKEEINSISLPWPIRNLSVSQIKCYISWINKKTGRNFDLPTADEWEIVAAAGSTSKFPWGDSDLPGNAAIDGVRSKRPDSIYTIVFNNVRGYPIKKFPPNRWGLYDVIGNTWDLTKSCHDVIKNSQICSSYIVKGGEVDSKIQEINLTTSKHVSVIGGEFLADVAIRLVAVKK